MIKTHSMKWLFFCTPRNPHKGSPNARKKSSRSHSAGRSSLTWREVRPFGTASAGLDDQRDDDDREPEADLREDPVLELLDDGESAAGVEDFVDDRGHPPAPPPERHAGATAAVGGTLCERPRASGRQSCPSLQSKGGKKALA